MAAKSIYIDLENEDFMDEFEEEESNSKLEEVTIDEVKKTGPNKLAIKLTNKVNFTLTFEELDKFVSNQHYTFVNPDERTHKVPKTQTVTKSGKSDSVLVKEFLEKNSTLKTQLAQASKCDDKIFAVIKENCTLLVLNKIKFSVEGEWRPMHYKIMGLFSLPGLHKIDQDGLSFYHAVPNGLGNYRPDGTNILEVKKGSKLEKAFQGTKIETKKNVESKKIVPAFSVKNKSTNVVTIGLPVVIMECKRWARKSNQKELMNDKLQATQDTRVFSAIACAWIESLFKDSKEIMTEVKIVGIASTGPYHEIIVTKITAPGKYENTVIFKGDVIYNDKSKPEDFDKFMGAILEARAATEKTMNFLTTKGEFVLKKV